MPRSNSRINSQESIDAVASSSSAAALGNRGNLGFLASGKISGDPAMMCGFRERALTVQHREDLGRHFLLIDLSPKFLLELLN